MIRRVQRAVTEEAVNYLHGTYLDRVDALRSASAPRGRVLTSSTALGAYDSQTANRQGCLLRMISVVEAYVDISSASLFRESTPTAHDLVRLLVENTELRASATWADRKAAFEMYHKIRFGEFVHWSELDAGIEVRNAIAHGLGQLTPRQRASKITQKLSQIGVVVNDGRVIISDASLQRCRDVCIEFIRYVDAQMPPP